MGRTVVGQEVGEDIEHALLVPVHLVLEQVLVSVPHDEAPMRLYILCEVWGKAFERVIEPCLKDLKVGRARTSVGSERTSVGSERMSVGSERTSVGSERTSV